MAGNSDPQAWGTPPGWSNPRVGVKGTSGCTATLKEAHLEAGVYIWPKGPAPTASHQALGLAGTSASSHSGPVPGAILTFSVIFSLDLCFVSKVQRDSGGYASPLAHLPRMGSPSQQPPTPAHPPAGGVTWAGSASGVHLCQAAQTL